MIRFILVALACCIALPACAREDAADTCGAAGLQGLVGQSGEIARLLDLAQPTRLVAPGDMVTMDFRPDRLNIELDAEDRITVLRCG